MAKELSSAAAAPHGWHNSAPSLPVPTCLKAYKLLAAQMECNIRFISWQTYSMTAASKLLLIWSEHTRKLFYYTPVQDLFKTCSFINISDVISSHHKCPHAIEVGGLWVW